MRFFTRIFATTLLATLALAAPAPAPAAASQLEDIPSFGPLSITLSASAECEATLDSGFPSNLIPKIWYPIPSGFSSMEIYGKPAKGNITIYDTWMWDQVPIVRTQNFSTEIFAGQTRGCVRDFEFKALAVMYTPFNPSDMGLES